MKVRSYQERIVPVYRQEVEVPEKFRQFCWDAVEGKIELEKLIYRVLQYGNFEEIKEIYSAYPEEVESVTDRYEVHRGVRFWIKYWKKNGRRKV